MMVIGYMARRNEKQERVGQRGQANTVEGNKEGVRKQEVGVALFMRDVWLVYVKQEEGGDSPNECGCEYMNVISSASRVRPGLAFMNSQRFYLTVMHRVSAIHLERLILRSRKPSDAL